MTKAQVVSRLGQPLRVKKDAAGRETWFYNTVEKMRRTGVSQNYIQPGESAYDRDLRLETRGAGGIVEVVTTERYAEKPLHFDANGRLTSSPPYQFLPNR